jgi:hypothetical protein
MIHADTFFALARERETIRRKRLAGDPPPWTHDSIFACWKFCNVNREHDKTTAWFREHVRSQLTGHAAVEATFIFRWFNRIETGEIIKDLLLGGWDTAEARRRLVGVKPCFTGAYIIKSPQGYSKLDGVLWTIDRGLERLPAMVPLWGASLQEAWADLCTLPYMGRFNSYEVVTDLRWTPVLGQAADIMSWAAAGPGCARGLGYTVSGDPEQFNYNSPKDQAAMCGVMQELLAMSRDSRYWPAEWEPWEMREPEMWACEVWKYIRCRDHGQPPRSRFGGRSYVS